MRYYVLDRNMVINEFFNNGITSWGNELIYYYASIDNIVIKMKFFLDNKFASYNIWGLSMFKKKKKNVKSVE